MRPAAAPRAVAAAGNKRNAASATAWVATVVSRIMPVGRVALAGAPAMRARLRSALGANQSQTTSPAANIASASHGASGAASIAIRAVTVLAATQVPIAK